MKISIFSFGALRFAFQGGNLLFAQPRSGYVKVGQGMAVWAVESACVSTVNRDKAGSWNPVIVELFFAFWAGQP